MENEIYSNKQLIGTGSNGNRVYKVLNTKDGKVSIYMLIISSTLLKK